MNTQYALKTLNQLRPVLIGFRKANGLTQKDVSERALLQIVGGDKLIIPFC